MVTMRLALTWPEEELTEVTCRAVCTIGLPTRRGDSNGRAVKGCGDANTALVGGAGEDCCTASGQKEAKLCGKAAREIGTKGKGEAQALVACPLAVAARDVGAEAGTSTGPWIRRKVAKGEQMG